MAEPNQYDPATDTITLRPDASLYVRFHEEAHREQYRTHSWLVFLRNVFALSALGNYLATIWIEFDALRRARRTMRALGIWNLSAAQEATRGFRSYVFRKELA
jgi:hypothetical protein